MNSLNSGVVKNEIKISSVLVAVIVHSTLALMTLGLSLVILLVVGVITNGILGREIEQVSANASRFNRHLPFKYYGEVFGHFQHVFSHRERLDTRLYRAIEAALTTKTPIEQLKTVTIDDIDKGLNVPEQREFVIAEAGQTSRGTSFTVVIHQSSFGEMQSIQWQVLGGGFIDRNKKFKFLAYSMFSFLFWFPAYLKKESDLLSAVRTIYSGAYNDMDANTHIRCLHESVFDVMIKELDQHGVDTSSLTAQKVESMNISISGGKVSMGNIVQGAMNKVTNKAAVSASTKA
jgi:hypothetical protein